MKINTRSYTEWPYPAGRPENYSSRWGASLRRQLAAINGFLTRVYRLYGREDYPAAVAIARTLKLTRGAVLSLTPADGVNRLRVLRGDVWLTGTLMGGDILLHPGDLFSLIGPGPFVIEALSDMELVLEP